MVHKTNILPSPNVLTCYFKHQELNFLHIKDTMLNWFKSIDQFLYMYAKGNLIINIKN